jgi:hypothetical protein
LPNEFATKKQLALAAQRVCRKSPSYPAGRRCLLMMERIGELIKLNVRHADLAPTPLSTQSEWRMVDLMALTKAYFWRYEREYRVIAPLRRPDHSIMLRDNFYHFAPSDITGVTVGLRMSADDRRELGRVLDQRRQAIEVFQCVEDHARFALKIRPVDQARWLPRL